MKSKFYFYSFIFLFFINISQLFCMQQQELTCPICHELIDDPDLAQTLPCHEINANAQNHTFHLWCIDPWLLDHTTCPICRTEIGFFHPTNIANNIFEAIYFDDLISVRFFMAICLKLSLPININKYQKVKIPVIKNSKIIKLIITVMLNQNPDSVINIHDKNNNTFLHVAADLNLLDLVKFLINKMLEQNPNAEINPANNDGITPLHIAAENSQDEIFEYIFEKMLTQKNNTDTNPQDKNEVTPLEIAIKNSSTKIINKILSTIEY